MKKQISVILIFVIMFIFLSNSISLGAIIDESKLKNSDIILYEKNLIQGGTQTDEEVIDALKTNFGYNKDILTNPIRLKTQVTITWKGEILTPKKHTGYSIKIGKKEIEERKFSKEDLRGLLGYEANDSALNVGTSWNVTLDASVPEVIENPYSSTTGTQRTR